MAVEFSVFPLNSCRDGRLGAAFVDTVRGKESRLKHACSPGNQNGWIQIKSSQKRGRKVLYSRLLKGFKEAIEH